MLSLLLAALFLAPPEPPRQLCTPPYRTAERLCTMLFFDTAEVEPSAWPILDKVIAQIEDNEGAKVVLAAYTDDARAPAASKALSQRMAENTRDYLVQHGVDPATVSIEAWGAANPRKPAPGKVELENLRVEVWVMY
jgi:outer membrane protein OmpA-like peptidoglycan-associated protein